MSDQNLSIIIKTILASAQESDLDGQIKRLSTQIKERLELKLKIDASDLQVLTKQTEEIANKLKTKTKMKGSQFINLDVEHQAFNEISSRIREVRKNVDELAKVDINTNKKGQMTSATLTYYNKELGQTITETMGWSEAQKKVNGELVKMRTFETQGFKYSDNMAKANAEAEKLVKNNNAVTNSLLAQKNAIEQRDFNYGSLITGVNASTFNSGGNFSSYIRQQYGDSAELIGKFNDKQLKTGEIITQANFRVKEGADKWRMYQATLNKTTGEMRMLDNGLKDVVNRQLKFSEAMKIAITRIGQWGIATSLVYGSLRQLRNGLETLKELDTLMVDINKVTNMTADSMERMKNASFDTASGYGQKAQSYLSGVAEFSRAGYEEAAGGLSEISLLAQNVGELTSEQANQFLLATDAAYKYKGSQEELTKVLDGVNQIDNKFATSIQKVSEGMTVAGSIASNAGVEVAELSSAIGVMTAITQRSGNEAGRAFRSILMNIRQVKGETEDGEIIDDEALSKSAKALDSVNIKVHEMRNGVEELRNPMDVLKELADKWKTLSTMDQSAITEALGGKYRGNEHKLLTAPYVQRCA